MCVCVVGYLYVCMGVVCEYVFLFCLCVRVFVLFSCVFVCSCFGNSVSVSMCVKKCSVRC